MRGERAEAEIRRGRRLLLRASAGSLPELREAVDRFLKDLEAPQTRGGPSLRGRSRSAMRPQSTRKSR